MTFTPYNGTVPAFGAGLPVKIVSAGDDPTLIVNNDTAHAIFLGGDSGVNPARPSTAVLPVQGSITVDGSEDVYGICAAGQTALFQTLPATDQWQNPVGVQIALQTLGLATEATQLLVEGNTGNTVSGLGAVNSTLGTPAQDPTVNGLGTTIPVNISTTGAPLLALASVFANPGAQTFTAGQTRQYGPGLFPQISYEIAISLISNASETIPFFTVTLTWSNSATSQVVATETWYLGGSPGSPANTYSGTGRAKGDTLTVTVTNNGTLASGSCRVVITQSSRLYVKDDFRSIAYNGIPGVVNSTYDPNANVLMATASNVGAGAQISRSLPLYAGTVRLSAFSQTAIGNIFIGEAFTGGPLNNNTVFQQAVPSGGFVNAQFDLPRYQCVATLTNQGGATQQLGLIVMISEQNI